MQLWLFRGAQFPGHLERLSQGPLGARALAHCRVFLRRNQFLTASGIINNINKSVLQRRSDARGVASQAASPWAVIHQLGNLIFVNKLFELQRQTFLGFRVLVEQTFYR